MAPVQPDRRHRRATQTAVLEALGQLESGFNSADLDLGRIHSTGHMLPFHQEIVLTPAPQYIHAAGKTEVTLLATP